MTQELPERDLLRTIDPAPHPRSALQQERHLRAVQARIHPAPPARTARALMLPVLVGSAAAALAAVLVLPAVLPQGVPIAPVDHAPGRPVAVAAVGSVTRSGVRIIASTRVGGAVFLLGSRGTDVRLAATFDGSDPDRNWERVGPQPAVGAKDVEVVSAANFPEAAPGGIAQLAGRAGADVASVDVRAHDGSTHHAAVDDGYWLTAWNGHDFTDADTRPATVTVHLRNGTTTTETYQRISER